MIGAARTEFGDHVGRGQGADLDALFVKGHLIAEVERRQPVAKIVDALGILGRVGSEGQRIGRIAEGGDVIACSSSAAINVGRVYLNAVDAAYVPVMAPPVPKSVVKPGPTPVDWESKVSTPDTLKVAVVFWTPGFS